MDRLLSVSLDGFRQKACSDREEAYVKLPAPPDGNALEIDLKMMQPVRSSDSTDDANYWVK